MELAIIRNTGDDGKQRVSLFASLDGEIFVDVDGIDTKENSIRILLGRPSTLKYSRDLLTNHGAEFVQK